MSLDAVSHDIDSDALRRVEQPGDLLPVGLSDWGAIFPGDLLAGRNEVRLTTDASTATQFRVTPMTPSRCMGSILPSAAIRRTHRHVACACVLR